MTREIHIEGRAVFTVPEASHYINEDEKTVRALLHSGELVGWRKRREWRVLRSSCDEWIVLQADRHLANDTDWRTTGAPVEKGPSLIEARYRRINGRAS